MTLDVLNCQLCDQAATRKYRGHTGYQTTHSYDIYHCHNCQTAFAWPLEVDEEIYNHIYTKIDRVPGYMRYLKHAQQVLKESDPLAYLAQSEDMYWSIKDYLKGKNPRELKILEIGCGFGYLTYALNRAGYDAKGLDISKTAVDNATKRYGELFICADIKEYANQAAGNYDIVIFTEVIEHIQSVKNFMAAADKLLKNDGDMVITTPNRTPYPEDILWETEPPPVHLWWFSENSIQYLAQQFNYSAKFIDLNDYSIEEVKRHKSYHQPYLLMRNYQPSRMPRLDDKGDVLELGDYIFPESDHAKKSGLFATVREAIKQLLSSFGLLQLAARIRDNKVKERLIKQLKANPQRRTTLCAVLKKDGYARV